MKTFKLKNLWIRLVIIVLVSSLLAILPLSFYSYEQYKKIEICKMERNGEQMLSALANLSQYAYSSAKGVKIKKSDVRRYSNELISKSKNITILNGKHIVTGRASKMLYSQSAIDSFIKNPASGEFVIEIGSHISQQSGLLLDENKVTYIFMDISSSYFPRLYSDIFKLSDAISKYSSQSEKIQLQTLVSRTVIIEYNIREISNDLRKACSMYEPTKTMAIIGNITKLNSTFAEFNMVMSKFLQSKNVDKKQAEIAIASLESVSNNLWKSTNGLLAESLKERANSILSSIKLKLGIFIGILFFILIVVFFISRSIIISATKTAEITRLATDANFAQAREMSDNSPCKIEPFATIIQNILNICDSLENVHRSSSELINSVEKLNNDATDIVSYQKPLLAGVTNGLLRIDSKIVMRDKSDATLASSAQSIRDKLGVLEQSVRLQSKSVTDVSNEIEQASDLASKLIASLSAIRETANKMNLIAETFTALADQANILGLNLAIETAKAGIKGSGLGTLAEQIRILSKRTVISVIDIESIRDLILEAIDNGANDAQKFLASLETDSKILEEISDSLSDMTLSLSKISSTSNTISVSLRERGTSDISLQDAQENLTLIEESLVKFAGFAKQTQQELSRLRSSSK